MSFGCRVTVYKRSLGRVIFSQVCVSVERGTGVSLKYSPLDRVLPGHRRPWTENDPFFPHIETTPYGKERTVRILLECIILLTRPRSITSSFSSLRSWDQNLGLFIKEGALLYLMAKKWFLQHPPHWRWYFPSHNIKLRLINCIFSPVTKNVDWWYILLSGYLESAYEWPILIESLVKNSNYLKNCQFLYYSSDFFWGHQSFLWSQWYPFWTSGHICPGFPFLYNCSSYVTLQ